MIQPSSQVFKASFARDELIGIPSIVIEYQLELFL